MTNKEKAEALRKAAAVLKEIELRDDDEQFHAQWICEQYADKFDPPYTLDRSLRGWVMIEYDSGVKQVLHAEKHGLTESDQRNADLITWDEVEKYGWKVTKLRILQPGQTAVGSALIREAFTLLRSARYDTSADKLEEILEVDELERMEENND